MRLGLFDAKTQLPWANYSESQVLTPYNKNVSLDAARQSIVLLKNSGSGNGIVLPLDQQSFVGKAVAVIGPNGMSTRVMEGNYNGKTNKIYSIYNGLQLFLNAKMRVAAVIKCLDMRLVWLKRRH